MGVSANAVQCPVGKRPAPLLGEAIPTVMLLNEPCRNETIDLFGQAVAQTATEVGTGKAQRGGKLVKGAVRLRTKCAQKGELLPG